MASHNSCQGALCLTPQFSSKNHITRAGGSALTFQVLWKPAQPSSLGFQFSQLSHEGLKKKGKKVIETVESSGVGNPEEKGLLFHVPQLLTLEQLRADSA